MFLQLKVLMSRKVLALSAVSAALAEFNEAYVCSACVMGLGLATEINVQIDLQNSLLAKCEGASACELAVRDLVLSLEAKARPEDLCGNMGLCTSNCQLFDTWPVVPLPDAPPAWPIERKLENSIGDLSPLREIFKSFVPVLPEGYDSWAHLALALNDMFTFGKASKSTDSLEAYPDACAKHNVTCHIEALVDHKPMQDHDNDRFSSKASRRMRGSDWRGYDCNDQRDDVYPGRKTLSGYYDENSANLDHNCNGIYGGNQTGHYEDIFCANSQPRGIAILGDSATAHFHIPPQWVTAKGWNLDQLLPDAMNELDVPHCSWGTGHAPLTECPYQYPIVGQEGATTATSLYSLLVKRNRCNFNDFQNIGVNGARVTSSMQLKEALARDQANDLPLLVYYALIGNDVCNGHPGFDHMTTQEEFYTSAMATFNALDTTLPPNSFVVSLALFDGELLYATMHNRTHPIGTSYDGIYGFMNCLEENPCWGWLNSDADVRRETTKRSDQLNEVYAKIYKEQAFKNFKFLFYSPRWVDLFNGYKQRGNSLSDMIEPVDGFHPSQTGNAVLAQGFFDWIEANHPEALGPINPYNDQIDAMFFNKQ